MNTFSGIFRPLFTRFQLLLASLLLLFSTALASHASPLQQPQTFHGVTAQLQTDAHQVAAGETFNAVWRFSLQPKWHVYWQNPGDVGLPYTLTWKLPTGWQAGAVDWPTPRPFAAPAEDPVVMSYGYADKILLPTPIHIPEDTPAGVYPLRLHADFLICEEICLPLSETFETTLTVGPTTEKNESILALLHGQPKPTPATEAFTVAVEDNTLRLTMTDTPLQYGDVFIPAFEGLIDDLAPQRFDAATASLILSRDGWADTMPTHFAGIILHADGRAASLATRNIPALPYVEEVMTPEEPPAFPPLTLWFALGFAFLAGMILNIMPCVLPVLTLKLFSLFKHTEHRFAHALSYAAGVMACFSALGLLLVGLKQAGLAIGWGFHLQSPIFVLGMSLFLCVVAYTFWKDLPLPPLFQNMSLRLKDSLVGSFGLGVFITLLATPCTVPFMGGAMAFALTAPAQETLLVLWAMGAGMAAPFMLAALLPHPPRLKSKYVAWIKPLLAIPVLLTAVWLFSVWLKLAGFIAPQPAHGWQSWAPETWEELQETADRPVLLNVTADWCLTCKVTERRVFSTDAFQTWAQENQIHLLEADWTRQDSDISALLESFGREGVPLYVFINHGEVRILPQFPSLSDFKQALVG